MNSNHHILPFVLINTIRAVEKITVLTGAGISAESGVPTFRDAQTGLWSRYKPEDLATPQAFLSNPKLVWEWYLWRRDLVSQAQPNPGHIALVNLEDYVIRKGGTFSLVTQNVDGLHQRAGNQNVIQLHGNVMQTRCFDCEFNVDETSSIEIKPDEQLPICPKCSGLLRPNVVWFGENLPSESLLRAQSASQICDIFFSIGTSSMVEPAASLPFMALQTGAKLVEINPNPTPLTEYANFALQEPAGEVLPRLIESIWSTGSKPKRNVTS